MGKFILGNPSASINYVWGGGEEVSEGLHEILSHIPYATQHARTLNVIEEESQWRI
jgi:hypothetical protein